jgi:hypothetical protein
MTDKVISYWETWPQSGYEPSLKRLKRLARIYQCNIGDLIDDGDFSHLDAATLHDRTPSAVAVKAATITKSAPRDVSAVGSLPSLFGPAGEDDEEVMRRRAFPMGLAALTGLGAAESAMALEGTRHGLNFALAERHASTDVEEWHEIALEYGHTYPITAPTELLKTLLVDLYGLQAAIGRYPDDAIQRELRQAALCSAPLPRRPLLISGICVRRGAGGGPPGGRPMNPATVTRCYGYAAVRLCEQGTSTGL